MDTMDVKAEVRRHLQRTLAANDLCLLREVELVGSLAAEVYGRLTIIRQQLGNGEAFAALREINICRALIERLLRYRLEDDVRENLVLALAGLADSRTILIGVATQAE